jgi:hypothetical protein
LNYFAVQCHAPSHTAAVQSQRLQQSVLDRLAPKSIMSAHPIQVALPHLDAAGISRAKSRRRLDQRVKHSLQVECRAANDLEHVGSRRLLLQRLVALAC